VNEDSVTARLVAVQSDGSVRTYQGAYLVRDGVITQASVRQIGWRADRDRPAQRPLNAGWTGPGFTWRTCRSLGRAA